MRILLIGQDNFFAGLTEVRADFLPTRRKSLIPNASVNRIGWTGYAKIIINLTAGRYTHCFVPAIYYDWNKTDRLKIAIRRILKNRIVIQTVRLLLRKTRIHILDYMDYTERALELAGDYRASRYFKVNLRRDQHAAGDGLAFHYLPFWINNPAAGMQPLRAFEERDVDVFFASTILSDYRKAAPGILSALRERGFTVVCPEERLSFQDFVSILLRTKVVLAPQGLGWHNYRYYESMACGSVPATNRSEEDVLTDMVGGVNCLIYDSSENAVEQISSYLRGESKLAFGTNDFARFAEHRHSIEAVGQYLLAMLADDAKCALEEAKAMTPA